MVNATATEAMPARPEVAEGMEKLISSWLEVCQVFHDWERRAIILNEPDEGTLARYRQDLKVMLRVGRTLSAAMKDPDLPPNKLARRLEGRLGQLEESWRCLNNPMGAEEAKRVLIEIFPEERDFIDRICQA